MTNRDDQNGGYPLVSVVMPVHNAERFLREAIASVLAQTHPSLELVLVDDGSSDGSWEIAKELARQDPRVRVFQNAQNLGIVKTRNRAFLEADPKSRYLAVLDSDDVCLPDRLAKQVAFLEAHPDHGIVGGHTLIIDAQGTVIGQRLYPTSHEQIARVITRYNPIAQPTVMIRRSALEAVGPYDERYPRCQDYELWLRIAARYKLANLDAFTLKYRVSATQGKRTHLKETLRLTLAIQRRWLFHPEFFHVYSLVYWTAEHLLLLLPDSLVMALFMRMTYRRPQAE